MSILRLRSAGLAFGHVALLDDADFDVEPGERLCLVGRNGAGKSTLLRVLLGEQLLDGGERWLRAGASVAMLQQEVPGGQDATLFDVVAAGLGDHSELLARYHAAGDTLDASDPAALARFSALQEEIERAGVWQGTQNVDATLDRLGLPPNARMSESSGGMRRRAMLGQALVREPDLLLLDEPTNHLDIESITGLEAALLGYTGTVVFVTHDRRFIDRLATRIVELDRGVLRSYAGGYADYLRRREAELASEADANRKFDQNLAQEEAWIRQGIKARRTRNEGRVRRLEALRRERGQRRERAGGAQLALETGSQSGKIVVEARDVGVRFGDAWVFEGFSTKILRGDRVGIIGPNGSGKTTLLKTLLGDLPPTRGSVERGTRQQIAFFDQEREQLDLERSVRDNVADGQDRIEIGGKSRHVIGYLGDFLFPPARANSPVKSLSGGERNRLLLARLFTRPANVLVLDEPTNDLDVETLELLEETLEAYDGTLLLVSHDREFIDKTVTSTLVIEDRRVEEHVGGYSDWRRYADARLEARARQATKSQAAAAPRGDDGLAPRTKSAGRRLGYKEQRELAALPQAIEALEARQAELTAQTSQPDFYQGDAETIAKTMRSLADLAAELEAAYERWEELESLQA
ncbi:MAG: ATP-binding cassette domain-containing protein [Pseudomonadota bacterium]